MYSVASKNIHGIAYFLLRGRFFLPTLLAFCTIYAQLWAEKGHIQCDVLTILHFHKHIFQINKNPNAS